MEDNLPPVTLLNLLSSGLGMFSFQKSFLFSAVVTVGLSACASPEVPADVIFTGGSVWTGIPGEPVAQALAVKSGFIQMVGSSREVRALRGRDTEEVRLAGRLVVPGFIDSHTHFIPGGFQLSSVDLRDAASKEEFGFRVVSFARGLEQGEWVTGGDWDHERWGGELPRKDWIDSGTLTTPVLISRLDGHMALANSLALELAGITASTPVPPGGEIVLDEETGEPTGILKDEAMGLVSRVIPPSTEEELDGALDDAIQHALSMGVTQTHHMGGWGDLETFRRAQADGRLKMRVYSVVPISTWERLRDFVAVNGWGDDNLWWGGLKGFVDGSLGSTTAWFYDPYSDEPGTSGLLTTDTASLRRWAKEGDASGFQLIIHAIGDRANDWLLDVYEETITENGSRDRRPRIEHAQHLSPEAFSRFSEMGVIPAMQPFHAIDDGRWAEKRIGPERIKTTYAFHSLLEAGADLAFGSDWTVAPMDVRAGLYAALTRRTFDGANPGGWVPEEKINLEQALTAYTLGSARAGFMEDRVGTLESGKFADLVVLSQDLFEMDPVEIPTVEVDLTVVAGEIVYRREG